MADVITYKGTTELNAITAWSEDHVREVNSLRRLFIPDLKEIRQVLRTTFREVLAAYRPKLEEPDLLGSLDPATSWKDAKIYMSCLVCYVWDNVEPYDSNEKAADYVFRIAREGDRLYADCRYARTLLEKYDKQVSTIRKEAKLLHAKGTHFTKGKWSGVERPPTQHALAMASKKEEDREERREKGR
jgi:hypothetical protein